MKARALVFCVQVAIFAAGCASRYSLPLYMVSGNHRDKVKVEETQFLLNAKLGDPYNDQKILSGNSKCLVIMTASRGERIELGGANVFGYDENLKVRLFVELPNEVKPDTLRLQEKSFVQMLGRYTQSADEKIYLPDSGFVAIDSIANNFLYGSVDARFKSRQGSTLAFDGRFRARVKK